MTKRIISTLVLCLCSAAASARSSEPPELVADPPDRHIVKRGDTLWGISGKFLKEPWRWPEVWRFNRDQIRNPHRIYPGQVVVLDTSGPVPRFVLGEPVRLQPQVYSQPAVAAIPSIPQHAIEPFLSEPLVVEENGLASAPKIVATQESRVFLGAGNVAYVSGLKQSARLWQVYRPAKPIRDPETNEALGYEAFYLGSARVVEDGEPATIEIVNAKQEIGAGDRLIPFAKPDVSSYAPHAPERDVEGRVVSIYNGVNVGETGATNIVTLNRGSRDGLEVGHVLALYRNGRATTAKDEEGRRVLYDLPNERYGLVFVFRTFDRLSYALVMDTSRPVAPNDLFRKP